MQTLEFTAAPEAAGQRLDRFLADQCEGLTRSALQNLIEQGAAAVNGQPVPKRYKVRAGDSIAITIPDPRPLEAQPQNIPLDIVYEDAHLLVVNKPKGMVVHPAPGNPDGTLVNALLYHCAGGLSGIGGAIRPGIVHRIDKDTSGLLVVAKNDTAHQSLAAQIAAHTAHRGYEAIVIGSPRLDEGTIDKPIARHKTDRKKMAIVEGGREAVTHYTVLKRYRGYTHMAFRLETGRTHQIRVHMASIGHPIIGDPVYGLKKDRFSDIGGQCLHAARLTLCHPKTGDIMNFFAPLPSYFTDILNKLEKMQ